jgi:rubrerythrin
MDQQSESDLPAGAQERVGEDIHCRNCGYNLRTLSTGGVCPECGESVAVSTRRDLL